VSEPVIEYFDRDGTWTRPERAAAVDALVVAAGGGGSLNGPGQSGEAQAMRFTAPDIPETMDIQVGKGGRGTGGGQDGGDGCVVVVTYLEGGDSTPPDWVQLLKAAGMYREDGGPSYVERHGHRLDEPCSRFCRGNPAKLGGNGGPVMLDSWTGPVFPPPRARDYQLPPNALDADR
jgi:hypothetical protein